MHEGARAFWVLSEVEAENRETMNCLMYNRLKFCYKNEILNIVFNFERLEDLRLYIRMILPYNPKR